MSAAEIKAAEEALQLARQAVQESPTPANLEALARASDALARLKRAGDQAPSTFANAREVARHLRALGYRVAQSTVYEHVRAGYLKRREDGLFHLADVERYLEERDIPTRDGSRPSDMSQERLSLKERQAKLRMIEARARKMELEAAEAAGRLIPRERLELEMVARAHVLRSDLQNLARAKAAEIVQMVGGDPKKTPLLIQWLNRQFEDFLDRYTRKSRHKVEVPLT